MILRSFKLAIEQVAILDTMENRVSKASMVQEEKGACRETANDGLQFNAHVKASNARGLLYTQKVRCKKF